MGSSVVTGTAELLTKEVQKERARREKEERQSSPLGQWRYAKDFLDAATAVEPPKPERSFLLDALPNGVAYYLLGHSIELSLKAFLLCRGEKISKLSGSRYGHKLHKLRKLASKRKLGREAKLTQHQKDIVDCFSKTYADKLHEYFERGERSLPIYEELHQVAQTLVEGLHNICRATQLNKK